MIKEIIEQWESNKHKLKEWFKEKHPDDYEEIVKKIFEIVISGYSHEKITVIDDGDYQGTQIFFIPEDKYQPNIEDYIYTNTYYGSCSGCDTLLDIRGYFEDKPTSDQIDGYMTLALHLIQKIKKLEEKENE